MDWTLAALASTAILAGVNVADKRLLDVYFPSAASFNFVLGAVQTVVGMVVVTVVISIGDMPGGDGVLLALSAGILWALGLSFFFFGLRLEEVSRAIPVFNTFPLFASLLAVLFLGERLTGAHWGAIAGVVVGTALISVRPNAGGGNRGLIYPRALALLLIGAVVTGAALVVNKEALAHAPFWTVFGLRALGMGPAMAAFAYRPTLLAEVLTTLRNPKARWLYVRGEMVPANAALLLLQLALKLGPVSLVSAVIASRPLFVFFLSVAFSTRLWKVLDEPLDRDTLALKLVATALIVGGVVVLALMG